MTLAAILNLATALAPLVAGALTPTHVSGALVGAGILTQAEADADADLQALIVGALAAKADADRAAAGLDPQ